MTHAIVPPYIAVIFTSVKTDNLEGYAEMNEIVFREAGKIPGFIGMDSSRKSDGTGISISYWRDMKSMEEWRDNQIHRAAKEKGIADWYLWYNIKICTVTHEKHFSREHTEQ